MSIEPLTSLFVTELLNALDDIQRDIPIILDAYLEGTLPTELEIDIDLLATNLIQLRDSTNLTRSILEMNSTVNLNTNPVENNCLDTLDLNKYKSIGLAIFLHIHMLTDETSIYYTEAFDNPFDIVAGDYKG